MKIIPAIDIMDGSVVRLEKGDPTKAKIYYDSPQEPARRWEDAGADMLHIVDLDATLESGSNRSLAVEIAENAKIPIQVAGGLRSAESVLEMAAVASRVVVGTLALRNKDTLARLLDEMGSERIVVSLDHVGGHIAVRGWQERTNIQMGDALRDFTGMGVTEFLLTDITRDGMLNGPDIKSLRAACRFDANVIASGGISNAEDVRQVGKVGPYGVILGKALYEGRITIEEALAVC